MFQLPDPLHPAIVHFPIVLLLIGATVTQRLAFILRRNETMHLPGFQIDNPIYPDPRILVERKLLAQTFWMLGKTLCILEPNSMARGTLCRGFCGMRTLLFCLGS